MTHSALRHTLSFFAFGLLAGALFLAGGIAAVSQKEKPSEPESGPMEQTSSTTQGTSSMNSNQETSSTSLRPGMSEHPIPNTPQGRMYARKMVAKNAHCPDDEYMLLEQLGLL